ncbi:MAG: hypothetical protein AB2765_03820, partial [Candidatus Thiodiazotropha endolucinida]
SKLCCFTISPDWRAMCTWYTISGINQSCLNKENTAFSYTTTVLDDMKIINSVLSAGRYSVFYQGDRIEVTVAGPDIVQVILDENNDGSIEEQQQMTNDQFIAEALIVAQ